MIFCVDRLRDFLCREVARYSVWRGFVSFCVERLRDILCGHVV